ncbi:hypothetical protein J6590_056977 [Homalodisca vitripennis]|nr:hypothetical protein J6590_056977 [Homalodisca vitripennis]
MYVPAIRDLWRADLTNDTGATVVVGGGLIRRTLSPPCRYICVASTKYAHAALRDTPNQSLITPTTPLGIDLSVPSAKMFEDIDLCDSSTLEKRMGFLMSSNWDDSKVAKSLELTSLRISMSRLSSLHLRPHGTEFGLRSKSSCPPPQLFRGIISSSLNNSVLGDRYRLSEAESRVPLLEGKARCLIEEPAVTVSVSEQGRQGEARVTRDLAAARAARAGRIAVTRLLGYLTEPAALT